MLMLAVFFNIFAAWYIISIFLFSAWRVFELVRKAEPSHELNSLAAENCFLVNWRHKMQLNPWIKFDLVVFFSRYNYL